MTFRANVPFRRCFATRTATPLKDLVQSAKLPLTVAQVLGSGEAMIGQKVRLNGWLQTVRHQKHFSFLQLTDGTHHHSLQVIATPDSAKGLSTGCSISITGTIAESPKSGQRIELQGDSISLLGPCDPDTYPLAKKKHSLEYLREIAHLRPRTRTFSSVLRVRNAASLAIRQFFDSQGFIEVNTPILTSGDCEGAGEQFIVDTPSFQEQPSQPEQEQTKPQTNEEAEGMKKNSFFNTPVSLTVSGQLQAEMAACAMSRVYTFGPTFRADPSNTRHHLAEFWMLEPELAFADLSTNIRLAQDMMVSVVRQVLERCEPELAFFEQQVEENEDLRQRLQRIVECEAKEKAFEVMTYTEAIRWLQKEQERDNSKFQFQAKWGDDLHKEHERFLCEELCEGRPVFVVNYPKAIKPFYMKLNDEEQGGEAGPTVQAMDLLVPRIGELIGGSVREENYELLSRRMKEMNMKTEDYEWYLDLRRWGSVPHAGFGMGFERFVQFLTGTHNIRDVIPVPRHQGFCKF
ncbi:Asparagine--tRNA ligase [Balamuthia mandrillaris]